MLHNSARTRVGQRKWLSATADDTTAPPHLDQYCGMRDEQYVTRVTGAGDSGWIHFSAQSQE